MNKLMNIFYVSFFALVCSIPFGANAKTDLSKKTFINTSFENSVDKLPLNYRGHNIKLIYNKISEIDASRIKGDFETSEEHQKRLDKIKGPYILYGKVMANSLLAFKADNENRISIQYEADDGVARIHLHWIRPLNGLMNPSRRGDLKILVDSKYKYKEYVATNSYGSLVDAEKKTGEDWGLLVSPSVFSEFKSGKYGFGFEFPVDMEINAAKRLNKKIKEDSVSCLIIGNLQTTPSILKDSEFKSGTYDDPISINIDQYMVDFDIKEIWVFDKKSGEIFVKLRI